MSRNKSQYSDISERILELSEFLKTHKGITNSELLRRCGINHSFISNIKNGKIATPNGEMIRRIVNFTGCNAYWLLTGEGDMFTPNSGHSDVSDSRLNPRKENPAVMELVNFITGELEGNLSSKAKRLLFKLLIQDELDAEE